MLLNPLQKQNKKVKKKVSKYLERKMKNEKHKYLWILLSIVIF
jgi:hypothetical protein